MPVSTTKLYSPWSLQQIETTYKLIAGGGDINEVVRMLRGFVKGVDTPLATLAAAHMMAHYYVCVRDNLLLELRSTRAKPTAYSWERIAPMIGANTAQAARRFHQNLQQARSAKQPGTQDPVLAFKRQNRVKPIVVTYDANADAVPANDGVDNRHTKVWS